MQLSKLCYVTSSTFHYKYTPKSDKNLSTWKKLKCKKKVIWCKRTIVEVLLDYVTIRVRERAGKTYSRQRLASVRIGFWQNILWHNFTLHLVFLGIISPFAAKTQNIGDNTQWQQVKVRLQSLTSGSALTTGTVSLQKNLIGAWQIEASELNKDRSPNAAAVRKPAGLPLLWMGATYLSNRCRGEGWWETRLWKMQSA